MTNKERLEANNAKIDEITKALANKQVSPTDMLQARVDSSNLCDYLFYYYLGTGLSFIKDLDTSNATSMTFMFSGCSKLLNLNLSHINTNKVTNMRNMFQNCDSLTELDLSSFDTSNVTDMSYMFLSCDLINNINVSSFDTTNVKSMVQMFRDCVKLTTLDVSHFNTENVNSMNSMFDNCVVLPNLDVSNFNTSNVTDMGRMFYGCQALTSLDLSNFDTSKVKTMGAMFESCKNLQEIDLSNFDMSKVTTVSRMFFQCWNAETIKGLNWEGLTSSMEYGSVFDSCDKLKNLGIKNITQSFTISANGSLNVDSRINLFKEMWDYTGSTAKRFKCREYLVNYANSTYVKLIDITDEMRAEDKYIDKKKPFVVCESTDEGAMTLTEYATSKNWSIVKL